MSASQFVHVIGFMENVKICTAAIDVFAKKDTNYKQMENLVQVKDDTSIDNN